MRSKKNAFSYFNSFGALICIFVAWASYFEFEMLKRYGFLALIVFCMLKLIILIKLKADILETDTPLLFKLSNHLFGISFIIMDIFLFYVNRGGK